MILVFPYHKIALGQGKLITIGKVTLLLFNTALLQKGVYPAKLSPPHCMPIICFSMDNFLSLAFGSCSLNFTYLLLVPLYTLCCILEACGSSGARDYTRATAVSQATAGTMLNP